jgi:hypothetical protein
MNSTPARDSGETYPLDEPEKEIRIINPQIYNPQSENCIFASLKAETIGEMRDILEDVGDIPPTNYK